MTKMEAYVKAKTFGREAAFVANLVLCWHRNPARKLRGLLRLLEQGHDVRVGNDIDVLLIGGQGSPWAQLEEPR